MWRAGGGRHRAGAMVSWETILHLLDKGKASKGWKKRAELPIGHLYSCPRREF
jgi:hypothetical protein